MFFLGLAENLGKLILINLLKDIGKSFIFNHHGEKDHKVDGKFLSILNNKLLLAETEKNHKKLNIKDLLKELKLKIKDNLALSNKEKERLLAKLEKIQKLIKEKEHLEYAELGIDSDFLSPDFPTFNVDLFIGEKLKKEIKEIKLALKKDKNFKAAERDIKIKKVKNLVNLQDISKFERKKIETKLTENSERKDNILNRKYDYLKEIEALLKKNNGKIEWKNKELQSKIAENKIKFQNQLLTNSHKFKDEKSELINFSHTLLKSADQQKVQIKSEPVDFQTKILNQIKKGIIQNNIRNEISIKLHPPELGKVHIKLAMINNELTAKVITQHSDVKQVILNNLNTLQEALKEKGINLSNFQVSVQGEFAQSYEGNRNGYYSKKDNRKFTFSSIEDEKSEIKEIFYLISELENKLNLKI